MVVKVYVTGISASKEIKKRQQRACMILDSLRIRYECIDLSESGHEEEKENMKTKCKTRNNQSQAFPPQFFNDDKYCGDYEDFELASDDDDVMTFLKLEEREDVTIENGDVDD